MTRLIRTDTNQPVTIAGPALPDGRVLVQDASNGAVEVINVEQLAVTDGGAQ